MVSHALPGTLGAWPSPGRGPLEGRAERSEAGLGTTKEVLGFIIDFDFKDFLGFPILLLGFPRISIRILSGF